MNTFPDITGINKMFENRMRLGIMTILTANERMDFNSLKKFLQVTDGNLASHLAVLEQAGYLIAVKQFIGRKPNTTYSITETGRKAFASHLEFLEKIIQQTRKPFSHQ